MIIRHDRRGFTIAELLIVVAIIGVLTSISIPVFTSQLEKSREATDLANVRSAYAEVITAEMTGDTSFNHESAGAYYLDVQLKQKQADWQMSMPITLGGVSSTDSEHWIGTPRANGCCKIKILNGQAFFYWNGNALATVAGDDGYQNNIFWYQHTSGGTTYLSQDLPEQNKTYKSSVTPVTLNVGDSFSVSKNCAIRNNQAGNVNGIFAFYLTEEETTGAHAGQYRAIVDSGWLNDSDFSDGFTSVNTFGNDISQYYSVEKQGDRLVFTVVKEEGLTLVVNNNTPDKADMMLNDVIINRAD